MMRSAREEVSACASVLATIKSTPDRPDTIMLLTALPPAPPTPHTMMRGFNSLNSGALMLMVIVRLVTPTPAGALPLMSCLRGARRDPDAPGSSSKTLFQPAPHPRHVAVV